MAVEADMIASEIIVGVGAGVVADNVVVRVPVGYDVSV
jgi:hypothetical protein